MDERRSTEVTTALGDTARILAILYTLGFFAFVFIVTVIGVPEESERVANQLIGILSLIQSSIVGFYFAGTKAAEVGQRAAVVGRAQADATIQEIARTAPTSIPIAVPVVVPVDNPPPKGNNA